jgi:hypothetical protein
MGGHPDAGATLIAIIQTPKGDFIGLLTNSLKLPIIFWFTKTLPLEYFLGKK